MHDYRGFRDFRVVGGWDQFARPADSHQTFCIKVGNVRQRLVLINSLTLDLTLIELVVRDRFARVWVDNDDFVIISLGSHVEDSDVEVLSVGV